MVERETMICVIAALVVGVVLLGALFMSFRSHILYKAQQRFKRDNRRRSYRTMWREGDGDRVFGIETHDPAE